ncbi:MAG: DUF2285 domain-containing protein [Bradyrhizobiaceae bacterium]|nr:hypothetical protein BBta_1487 [Bradyrhizobium sp. BTAi1]MDH6264456.1 hypothetical protein [Bradyrhizobium sp. BR13661]RTL91929.1 MAG: DUF2285 domain-containing protein [Bradyrhizobiaceae bacterium]
MSARVSSFDSNGGWFFAADPGQSYLEQTIFWAPEVLATVIPVRPALIAGPYSPVRLDLSNLDDGQLRQGPDGWHAVMHLRGVEHRIWCKEAPLVSAAYTVEYPLDRDFEFRVDAGRRLWRGLNGRPQGAPLHALSVYRRRRLALALRALDARTDGATYREIAEVLLPAHRIGKRDWRTHDLRSQIVRLVKTGFALAQDGYRALLRPPSRRK